MDVRRIWDGVVGPGATRGENAGILAAALAGALLGVRSIPSSGLRRAAAAALGADLLAGAVANNALPASRYYHRAGTGPGDHLRFVAAHVHPFAVAGLGGRGAAHRPWAVRTYAYAVLGTTAIMAAPVRLRRPLAALVCCVAAAHDAAADDAPPGSGWTARTLHVKLLLGHALHLEPAAPTP